MNGLPVSVDTVLRRLSRRLALGVFLDVWPPWAAASLLLGGMVALACRLSFSPAAPHLRWLWMAPVVALVPAVVVCVRQRYRAAEIAALADALSGGQGLLLTLLERGDERWSGSPIVERAVNVRVPGLRPWPRLAPLAPAAAFLAAALLLPQRVRPADQGVLADEVVREITATLAELKQQQLVTPEEEQALAEEVERIRRAADTRVDAGSWEAADAVRERMAAAIGRKHDAAKWAEDSLQRYSGALQAGAAGTAESQAAAAELTEALQKLAEAGLLEGAPAALQAAARSGRLPADPESLRALTAALAEHLGEARGRMGGLAKLGGEFGRFDPSEFPLGADTDGDGRPGSGGVDRGRADAPLTWGKETAPHDRFKAQALPPGAARSPDDWAPLVEVPGAPGDTAVLSTPAAARRYERSAGQAAWRRTLAPRHQSAVKKYFAQ